MIKYNYKGAAGLWSRLYSLCFSPWDLDNPQKDRRDFMRDITRGKKQDTIDFLWNSICFSAVPPVSDDTRKHIKAIDILIDDIIDFKGVI